MGCNRFAHQREMKNTTIQTTLCIEHARYKQTLQDEVFVIRNSSGYALHATQKLNTASRAANTARVDARIKAAVHNCSNHAVVIRQTNTKPILAANTLGPALVICGSTRVRRRTDSEAILNKLYAGFINPRTKKSTSISTIIHLAGDKRNINIPNTVKTAFT